MTTEELEAKLAEATSKLEETTAKLEETTRHSREWENRAKANKAKADELEQLKADESAVKELDERIIPACAGQTMRDLPCS